MKNFLMSSDPKKEVFNIKRDISQHYIKKISHMWGHVKLPIIGIVPNPKGGEDIPNGILGFEVFEILYKLFRCCTCGSEGWKMGTAKSVLFLNALGRVAKDRPDGKFETMFEKDVDFDRDRIVPVEGDKWIHYEGAFSEINTEEDVFLKDDIFLEDDYEEDEEGEEEDEEDEDGNIYPGQEAFFLDGEENEEESSEESPEESPEEEKCPLDDIDTRVLQWIKGTESDTENESKEEDMERKSKRARRI